MSISNTNINLRETHIIGSDTREQIVSAVVCPALAPYQISLVGLTKASTGFQFTRSDPQWGQILACTGGSGWVWVDPLWERCAAGQAYVTPPHRLHAYRVEAQTHRAEAQPPWSLCWVQSPGEWLCSDRPSLVSADPGPLSEAIHGLHREAMQPLDPALLTPWAFLVSSYARRLVRPDSNDPRLRRLWESVSADLAAPWTVGMLARFIAVSPEHLRRLCHLHHATSPMRQISALRMRRAAALLASESYTVEAVARLVGYDNPYTFSTAFKRTMGGPPSAYRQGKPRGTAKEVRSVERSVSRYNES